MNIRRVCIFCGSSMGHRDTYRTTAREVARGLAQGGMELVYGGASVGLMREIADTMIAEGGRVIGVIPEVLVEKEVAHEGITDLRLVGSMHERKALMNDLSDAFVTLPGGFGSIEELFEVLTWAQLGLHQKPIGLLNIDGYYDGLLQWLDHAVAEGFLKPSSRNLLLVHSSPSALAQALAEYVAVPVDKWIGRETS